MRQLTGGARVVVMKVRERRASGSGHIGGSIGPASVSNASV